MNAIAVVRGRLEQLRTESGEVKEKRNALVDKAIQEARQLTQDEHNEYNTLTERRTALKAEFPVLEERLRELEADAQRSSDSAETRRQTGGAQVTEAPIYREDNQRDASYFRDIFRAKVEGDAAAMGRLGRNAAIESERRAGGNTVGTVSTPGGIPSGNAGVFAPPAWLIDQYVKLARPGRVGVDTFDKMPLPSGVSSINLPRVTAGTLTGLQSAGELTPLPERDITTDEVTSGITTIGGKQLVSLQLLNQSAIPFDRVLLEDLAMAYANNINTEGLGGSGTNGHLRGLSSAVGMVLQTYTDASPDFVGAGKLYTQIMKASATIHANRFRRPDSILMRPERWSWIASRFDTTNRPVVLPQANNPFNTISSNPDLNVAEGSVGQIAGLAVFVDPSLPLVGNQDPIYVYIRSDIKLWESEPNTETFTATYADSAGVLYRMMGYAAQIPDRYGSSIVQISGSGLSFPPTF
ncbi:phage major capsid protein [Nocardia sp. NPDC058058]|uniref:phage major capsid protein n=1 Tax=Nocardia sp. NPDC058058 TaxID=3346317 RepID=UPI0036DE894E